MKPGSTGAVFIGGREHHWDALRALFMLLGIPYHVALTYRAGEVWIVNAHEGGALFALVAEFIHLFRMPAFFIIAGYFSGLLLTRRSPSQWLGGRFRRLGIPFAMALVTLNPLLNIACELSNFSWHAALGSWVHNSAHSGGYWIRHLWFLIVLLYFSMAAALAATLFPRLRQGEAGTARDSRWAGRFALVWLALAAAVGLWQAVSIELFYMAGLATNVPQQILRLDETLQYAPYYLIGFALARMPAMRERLYRVSPPVTILAVVFTGLTLMFAKELWPPYGRFLETFATLCLIQPIIAVTRHLADRPRVWVDRLVDSSFVLYLFHLPIMAGLVVLFQPVAIPVLLKAGLVGLFTLLLSWSAWEIVSRSSLLSLLYEGKAAKREERRERLVPALAGHSTQSSPMSR